MREARKRVLDLDRQRERMVASFPTVMVMQESPTPRETHLLLRGAYDRPGEKVSPGVPAVAAAAARGRRRTIAWASPSGWSTRPIRSRRAWP